MLAGTGGLGAAALEPGTCRVCLPELSAGKERGVTSQAQHRSQRERRAPSPSPRRAGCPLGRGGPDRGECCLAPAGSWHGAQPHTAPLSPLLFALWLAGRQVATENSREKRSATGPSEEVCVVGDRGGDVDLGSPPLTSSNPQANTARSATPREPPCKPQPASHYLRRPSLPRV